MPMTILFTGYQTHNILLTADEGEGHRLEVPGRSVPEDLPKQGWLWFRQYFSPEQAKGQPVGPQSDLYALGVFFMRCSPGSTIYRREPHATALKHIQENRFL